MKKTYKHPVIINGVSFKSAAPLAFFSAATAAASVLGIAAGAVATKSVIRALPNEKRNLALTQIKY